MKKEFTPMRFLAALGAGGIAVAPFSILQYVYTHPEGLVKLNQINLGAMSLGGQSLTYALYAIMITFTIIHVILSSMFFKDLFTWKKSAAYGEFMNDPLKNSSIMAPFLSIIMTMNVVIGPVRFFVKPLADNLQVAMLPALVFLGIIWLFMMKTEIFLLKNAFSKNFDADKINFGWLIQSFALAMGTVTATGIAALAKNPDIAHAGAAMSFISGSMAVFILIIKLPQIFKNHFHASALPEHQAMPSFLIVVPILTLLAISGFRIGHYMERTMGYHLDSYFVLVIGIAFAIQTWYLAFGISLMKDFLKTDLFKREYYVSMWGLICPFVAYAVLGAFLFKVWVPYTALAGLILVSLTVAISLYVMILKRKARCIGWISKSEKYNCGSV